MLKWAALLGEKKFLLVSKNCVTIMIEDLAMKTLIINYN